jgi:hypothetical protein
MAQEFKVPDRKELQDAMQAGVTWVTARVLNVPVGVLVDPERLARQKQALVRVVCVLLLLHCIAWGSPTSLLPPLVSYRLLHAHALA